MTDNNELTTAAESEKKKTLCFSAADTFFAWFCFLLGYLFCRVFPLFQNPLGGFTFVLLLFTSTFTVLKIKKIKIPVITLIIGISAIVASSSLLLTDSETLMTLSYTYALFSYCYFVFASLGNSMERGFSDYIPADFIKAVFIMPFYAIMDIFHAVANKQTRNCMNILKKVACGIALAVVPTAVILLLLSYDDTFTDILTRLFTFDTENFTAQFMSILFAVPVGTYIFAVFSSSSRKLLADVFTAQDCKNGLKTVKIMPQTTALTAVVPILFVYAVYFVSQWKYYVSGFTGVLPESFSYAQYAREGFFQLCAVSAINLVIMVAIVLFMRRDEKKNCISLQILTVVFCLFTLVLISTAIAKLVMYIDCYGLTQKRIYALWLMILIAAVYIIIAVGQFVKKIKTLTLSLAVCILLFCALALSDVNGIIARHNVEGYIDGNLYTVDIPAMEKLGNAAIPSLVRLAEYVEDDPNISFRDELFVLLDYSAEELNVRKASIFSFNFPTYKAEKALSDLGLVQ